MLMAEELDSKNPDNGGIAGQISFGEDDFYKKYEQKIKLLTDKFMPPRMRMSIRECRSARKWSSMRITAIICHSACMSRLRTKTAVSSGELCR